MTFAVRTIDVNDPDVMATVQCIAAHPLNPFAYRIVCPRDRCHNEVWPSQIYGVRDIDPAITGGVDYACDGCVSHWLRQPDVALDTPTLMAAHGATPDQIADWQKKTDAALPPHIDEGE